MLLMCRPSCCQGQILVWGTRKEARIPDLVAVFLASSARSLDYLYPCHLPVLDPCPRGLPPLVGTSPLGASS